MKLEPLYLYFDGLGKIKLELVEEVKLELQGVHLGDETKVTSTTALLNKENTKKIAMWLAMALEYMENIK